MPNKYSSPPPDRAPGPQKKPDSEVAKFVKYALPVFNTSILVLSGVALAVGIVVWLVLR